MAKVTLNPVLEAFRGKLGDLVFKRFGDEEIRGKSTAESRRSRAGSEQWTLDRRPSTI